MKYLNDNALEQRYMEKIYFIINGFMDLSIIG
jgi:hypothetical protein